MIVEPQPAAELLPLAGIRVLELGGDIAGAFCGKLLAGFGAEVVKVEAPAGDSIRGLGLFAADRLNIDGSLPFLYLNTSKQSVTLDPSAATGRDLLRQLAAKSDVLLQTLGPGESHSTYLDEAARSPGLVVTSIQDFGEGPCGDYLGGELIVLALALVVMLGNIIIAISIVLIPTTSRIVRSVVLSVRHERYIEAARFSGGSDLRIIARHILPNIASAVMVLTTANLGAAIVTEASLSFIGLGTPPTPSWGQMITGSARAYFVTAPWIAIFPGLTLSLLVLGINLFGDTLRDLLDPRRLRS